MVDKAAQAFIKAVSSENLEAGKAIVSESKDPLLALRV